MRKIGDVDKSLIYAILDGQKESSELFDIFNKCLPKDKCALVLSCSQTIFLSRCDSSTSKDVLLVLIQYVSLLKQLEDDGYIYVIYSEKNGKKLVQNGINPEIWTEEGVEKCYLGDLKIDETGQLTIIGADCKYVEEPISEPLSRLLCKYIMSTVVPSDKLIDFRKNNFLSDDAIKYRSGFRATLCGLIITFVALLVSIFSPFWMTQYNNEHAISTLDSLQYCGATKILEKLVNNTDSLLLEVKKVDTVFVETIIKPAPTKTAR